MKQKYKFLPLIGILCCSANAASPVLLNGNFDAFDINIAPHVNAYSASNTEGYNETFGNNAGAYSANYLTSTVNIGWKTDRSGTNDVIELWSSGYANISSASGTGQFAELNANEPGALYQDVTIATVGNVDYGFAHVNRNSGTDTMRVIITYLGEDAVFGGADDLVVVTSQFSTTNLGATRVWSDFEIQDAFVSIAGGTYRFSFGAVSSAPRPTESQELKEGNLIDNVRFGVDAVPEPSAALLGSLGALAMLRRRRR
jgi:hypothetical protein